MKCLLFYVSFLLVLVSAEQDVSSDLQHIDKSTPSSLRDQINVDKLLNFAKKIPDIATDELEDFKLDPSNLPSVVEGEEILKEKCLKHGNNQSYDEFLDAKEILVSCMTGLINIEEMQREIEYARPTGDLDEVFRKYCGQAPKLQQCIKNFTSTVEQCLDPREQETKEVLLNVTSALMKFMCFKEGDRIALFVAEEGPECLYENVDNIMNCVNDTVHKYLPEEDEEDNIEFVIKKQHCSDLSDIQKCVVKELEGCKQPTPANIVDSIFKFVRKSTPCATYDALERGASSTLHTSILLLFLSSAVLLSKI